MIKCKYILKYEDLIQYLVNFHTFQQPYFLYIDDLNSYIDNESDIQVICSKLSLVLMLLQKIYKNIKDKIPIDILNNQLQHMYITFNIGLLSSERKVSEEQSSILKVF